MNNNHFPITSFNKNVSDYITMLSYHKKISTNIVASSVLNACGFVLSDAYECEISPTWVERSNLWNVISLSSGMGKSVIMRNVFKPIIDYQYTIKSEAKKHNALAAEWKSMLKSMKIKMTPDYLDENPSLRNWLSKHNLSTPPEFKTVTNLFSDDFTFEKLFSMLNENQGHAFMLRADEVSGLFKTLNRYRVGNDEEMLLKLWGYDAIKIDRIKEDGDIFIQQPIISLFGATQKEMLFDIYTDTRKKNGNVFRILFTIDENETSKNVWESSEDVNNVLEDFMKRYLSYFTGAKVSTKLFLEDDCKQFLFEWRNNLYEKYVTSGLIDVKTYNSIMGKMDSYVIRIAIILNRINNYFDVITDKINVEDISNAANIVEFYVVENFNIMSLTDISYRRFLKNKHEIDFYENTLSQSIPYFEAVKSIETNLGYGTVKANNILNKWQECGIIKRNSKGMIYKVISKK